MNAVARAWRLLFALALGLGIGGAAFSALIFAFGVHRWSWLPAMLAAAGSAVWVTWMELPRRPTELSGSPIPRWLVALFGAAALLSLAVFASQACRMPDGDWDATMIWNYRARMLLRSGELDQALTAKFPPTHPDYPLMLPGLVAAGWLAAGEHLWWPGILSWTFSLLCTGLFVTAGAWLRGAVPGLLAGLVLLSSPLFIRSSSDQYADIPVATFLLVATTLLLLSDAIPAPQRRRALFLAGVAFSLAAFTKNEGLLHFVAFLAAVLLVGRQERRFADRLTDASKIVAGAVPVLVLLAYFKVRYAPSNDLAMMSTRDGLWRRVTDLSRYWRLLVALLRHLVWFQHWGVALAGIPVALWLIVRGRSSRLVTRQLGLGFTLSLAGIAAVFILTPRDMGGHINSALDRLILQLWPSVLLVSTVALPVDPQAESVTLLDTPAREADGSDQPDSG